MWSTTAGGQAWLWGCPPQSVPAHEASPGSLDREPPRTDSNPAKIHQGQPHLSHSGSAECSPSQPVCRRFPDPSQVNLCPVVPSPGTRGVYLLGNATAWSRSCSPGTWGSPLAFTLPLPCSPPALPPPVPAPPLRAASLPGGAGSRSPRGMRVGLEGALNLLSRSARAAAGCPPGGGATAGHKGPLTPPSVRNYVALSGGGTSGCVSTG